MKNAGFFRHPSWTITHDFFLAPKIATVLIILLAASSLLPVLEILFELIALSEACTLSVRMLYAKFALFVNSSLTSLSF